MLDGLHTHDYLDNNPRFPFTQPGVEDRAYMLVLVPPDAIVLTK